jgi:hypothetical protein
MPASVHRHPLFSRHELNRIAVKATCDFRCVVRYLRIVIDADDEMRIESTTRERIERAIHRIPGFEDRVRQAAERNGSNGAAVASSTPGVSKIRSMKG